MKISRILLLVIGVIGINVRSLSQTLPTGGQWGCPAIPIEGNFDSTCFQRTGQILLGQGFFDHYGSADPVYLVIPQNKPHYALSMAIGWNYFRNVVGNNSLSINQYFATMAQENGFATYYNGTPSVDQMPPTIYNAPLGATISLPCQFNRGCNNYNGGGGSYQNACANNVPDGPYQFSLAGYQTANPYAPNRFPAPANTWLPIYNKDLPTATMSKVFYDLAIYRKAQAVNGFNIGAIEATAVDKYGVDGALAVAYNLGPNSGPSIAANGYVLSPSFTTNAFNANSLFAGGVSNYAQRVACITATLDSNKAYAVSNCGSTYGGNANNWLFYNFYDHLIPWDTVAFTLNKLLIMYPTLNATSYLNAVQTKFNAVKGGAPLSFRYEFGPVLDAIILNLPKDDPAATAANAINGTGCSLGCTAPYTKIIPTGPTTVCKGQNVVLQALVDGATSTTTYQWFLNGSTIPSANGLTYTATTTGNYSVVVCWSATNIVSGNTVKCCASPECTVAVTILTTCSSCAMSLSLTQSQNACTGMPNGSVSANVSGAGATGNLNYSWSGPSSGSYTTTSLSYVIPGLRDGKYTVTVSQVGNPSCLAVQDIFVTPTTPINVTVSALSTVGSCNTKLNAVLVNQQPTTCPVQVSYGALGASWDASFFMDLKDGNGGLLNMFQGYNLPYSATAPNSRWDWYPFSYPSGGTGNAPNVTTITVPDGDIITAEGIVVIPLGIAAGAYINGAIRFDNATFTDLTTNSVSSSYLWTYQGAAPAPGLRQIGNQIKVTCPVVSPPAFTYAWSPGTGLNNPNIQNPISSHNVNPYILYTVTATLVANSNCKLTDTIYVDKNCSILPVDLISFDVEKSGQSALLSWQTSLEENFNYFIIEYSSDGITFSPIQTVTGNNKLKGGNYSYLYKNTSNVNYFKLKMVDLDGKYIYSEIKSLDFDKELKVIVQPNPFESNTELIIKGCSAEKVDLKLYSLQGEVVLDTNINSLQPFILGNDLSSGVYIVQINDGNSILTQKIIKN